jgi:Alr-MurF fusion protein
LKYFVDTICKTLDAKLLTKANIAISLLSIDSRQSYFSADTLFFAIVGERQNGHQYISEVYEKGGRAFVISESEIDVNLYPDANFILVPNTTIALQKIATFHRQKFKNIKIIGITGSNGKTIVKEWLFQILSDFNVVKSPASYNSQVGVPLSVWQIEENHEFGIFEAGISQKGEMELLENIIAPDYGIFTTIGEAHGENFENIEEKIEEKLKLFKNTKKIILSLDSTHKDYLLKQLRHKKIITWSNQKKDIADYFFEIERKQNKTIIKYLDEIWEVNFIDEASINNICHILCFIFSEKIEVKNLQKKLLEISNIKMRLELIKAENNSIIINDSYNFDFDSLKVALDFQNKLHKDLSKVLIITDMLQYQGEEKTCYQKIYELISKYPIEKIFLIGEKINQYHYLFKNFDATSYLNTEAFLNDLSNQTFVNQSILLKGARKFQLEKISRDLQQKSHSTVLEINLDHLIHNVNYFKSLLPKTSIKMMAMVKAFGYGSGGVEISKILSYNKIDYLAVAYSDEGIDLRKAGIKTPIVVLHPEEDAYEKMLKNNLEPEIFNARVLLKFLETVKSLDLNYPYPIHLKIDTGMHRLGFEENEIDSLLEILHQNKNLIVLKSVFSHLSASDDKTQISFTTSQIEKFKNISQKIENSLNYSFLKHILNSEGILNYPEATFDMVRLGIGMYGISYQNEHQKNLKNVSTLKTIISQIKHLKKGDVVGYTAKNKVEKDSTIATIPIGYAHGLSRKLGNGNAHVLVNGKKAKYIGNICMDLCMIDISDIKANEGDEVIIFGENISVQELAKLQGTISYEILSGISQRVKRTFLKE